MRLDNRFVTGILIGAILGLKYYVSLKLYLPILVIATVIMFLKLLRTGTH